MQDLLQLNISGGAGKKNAFSTENVRQCQDKKPPLSQYVKRGWHKKGLFTENL